MLKFPKLIWLACFLLLFISCGKSQFSSSSVKAGSSSYESKKPNHTPSDPARDRFMVTPEIAVMTGKIVVTASSFTETSKLLTSNFQKLADSTKQVAGCSAEIIDYQHPTRVNYKRLGTADAEKYRGNLQLEILISFAETNNVQERISQIDNCLERILDLKIKDSAQDKNHSIYLSLSQLMPTIKNIDSYRKQLLEFKFKPLKQVASLSDPASQFDALDTQCTSQGTVTVVSRSLSNIELDIDFKCRKLANTKQE